MSGRVANKPENGISQKRKGRLKSLPSYGKSLDLLFEEWLPATIATPQEKIQDITKAFNIEPVFLYVKKKRAGPES